MSNTNKPTGQQLSPDEILLQVSIIKGGPEHRPYGDIRWAMEQYAAQQAAALREELRIAKQVEAEYLTLYKELEAVKKERDFYRDQKDAANDGISYYKGQVDEAVKLLKEVERIIDYQGSDTFPTSMLSFSANVISPFVGRLSSGETKPRSPIPEEYPGKPYQALFDHLHNQHDLILTESQMYDIIEIVRKMDSGTLGSPWISVEDRLPEIGIPLWIWEGYKVVEGYYDYNNADERCFWIGEQIAFPTHFMPLIDRDNLPAPPESFNPQKQAGIINLANRMFGDESLT